MTGYEFVKFEVDFESRIKAQSYEICKVANKCKRVFDDSQSNYWQDPDYIDAKHCFIETTASCSKDEAIDWMRYYMVNAIAYGIQTKNLDWMPKFLAAWNLYKGLTPDWRTRDKM